MIIRSFALLALLVGLATPGWSQLEWDKPHTNRPLPNPSPVAASRENVVEIIKQILERNNIPIRSETAGQGLQATVIITEPVVFSRGIVAKSQLAHFAETEALRARYITRARATLRIEMVPTNPSSTLVGVYATFEGLSQAAQQEWIVSPSRGILEDAFLKRVVTHSQGDLLPEDLEKESDLLEVNEPTSSSAGRAQRQVAGRR